MNLGILRNP